MALIGPLAYAGYGAGSIAAIEAGLTVADIYGGKKAYDYYRNRKKPQELKSDSYIFMPPKGGQRPRNWMSTARPSKGAPRRPPKRYNVPRSIAPAYQKKEWMKVQNCLTVGVNSATDIFGQLKLSDLTSAPAWSRIAAQYDLYRIHSLQLKVFSTDGLTSMLTFPSYDDATSVTDRTIFLKNPGLYNHPLGRDKTCQRTIKLGGNPRFHDFLKTANATADLVTASTHDASIKYCILTNGVANNPANNEAQKCQMFFTWVIQVSSEAHDYTVS